MATQAPEMNKLSKEERKNLAKGIDNMIASINRANAREANDAIRKIRETEIEQLVVLKNKLLTKELEL